MRIEPLRSPRRISADEPLFGSDAGRDSARYMAAITIVGLSCLAVVAVGIGCYAWSGHEPVWNRGDDTHGFGSFATTGVSVDAPMLRPSLPTAPDPGITVFDAATGRSERLEASRVEAGDVAGSHVSGLDGLDTADASHAAGASGTAAPLAR